MSAVRGRFAPTPSGYMHIGNARTALLSWLQIRKAGGQFVMRMEDIDGPRCKPDLAEQALADLRWLGLDWDEGPDLGGPYAPYTQSERLELYDEALQQLLQRDLLYPCYCSRAELMSIASAPHGLGSEGPVYPGTCRHLTAEQRQEKALVKTPALRFKTPGQPIQFLDEAAGCQQFAAHAGGDFVVRRADGIISYQLAVVVDDAAMGITHVLRGNDLLDSTPRQLMLYEALGWAAPDFAHVPLLNGTDGKRLAKRHGSIALGSLRASGILPEQVIGWLAAVSGLLPKPEPIRPAELIAGFSLEQIPTEPVVVTDELMSQLLQ